MDLTKATPDTIKQYKNDWIPTGYVVKIKSDLDVQGKDWCRHNLDRWMWSMESFTDSTHHTFIFEHEDDADDFAENFDVIVTR